MHWNWYRNKQWTYQSDGTDVGREAMINFKHDIQITRLQNSYFLCGDLNAKYRFWNCIRGNRAEAIIYDLLPTGQFTIHYPSEPTHYPTQRRFSPSTSEIVLTHGRHNITQPIIATPGLFSDHQPIEFTLHCESNRQIPTHYIPCYKKANWHKYQQIIKQYINTSNFSLDQITSIEEIDEMITNLTSILKKAKDDYVPLVRHIILKLHFLMNSKSNSIEENTGSTLEALSSSNH